MLIYLLEQGIMIEQHVTSLEISKRLKELGVGIKHENNQESIFYWHEDGNDEWELITKAQLDVGQEQWCYSAFLASEFWALLPDFIEKDGELYYHNIYRLEENYHACFSRAAGGKILFPEVHDDNLTDAMGKMLIYLLEQGIIRV